MEYNRFWPSTLNRGTVKRAFEIGELGRSSTFFFESYDIFRRIVHVQTCGDAAGDSWFQNFRTC